MFGFRNMYTYLDLLCIATFCVFAVKMLSTYYVCCIYSNVLKNSLTMKANTMNLDQTGPKIAV